MKDTNRLTLLVLAASLSSCTDNTTGLDRDAGPGETSHSSTDAALKDTEGLDGASRDSAPCSVAPPSHAPSWSLLFDDRPAVHQDLHSNFYPPYRFSIPAVYDPHRQQILLWGAPGNTTWALPLDTPNPTWQLLRTLGDLPTPGRGAAAYDPLRQRLIVVAKGGSRAIWVHALDLTTMTWHHLSGLDGLQTSSSILAFFDPTDDQLIVLEGIHCHTWSFIEEEGWQNCGSISHSVDGHLGVLDADNRRILLVGGPSSLDLSSKPFQQQTLATSGAEGEYGAPAHSIAYDPVQDRLLLMDMTSDVWVLSLSDPNLTWMRTETHGFPVRAGHVAVYDPDREQMIVIGGARTEPRTAYTQEVYNDVWSFQLEPTPRWTPLIENEPRFMSRDYRPQSKMVYNSRRDSLSVLVRPPPDALSWWGEIWGERMDQPAAWVLDLCPPHWTPISDPPVMDFAPVYDPKGDRYLFASATNPSDLSQQRGSWSASGSPLTWQQILNETGPSTSVDTNTLWDNDRVLLFRDDLNELWELTLDPPGWQPIATEDSPFVANTFMAIDAAHRRLYLMGNEPFEQLCRVVWMLNLEDDPLRWQPLPTENGVDTSNAVGSLLLHDQETDSLLYFNPRGRCLPMVSGLVQLDLRSTPHRWEPIESSGLAPHRINNGTATPYGPIILDDSGGVWRLNL